MIVEATVNVKGFICTVTAEVVGNAVVPKMRNVELLRSNGQPVSAGLERQLADETTAAYQSVCEALTDAYIEKAYQS